MSAISECFLFYNFYFQILEVNSLNQKDSIGEEALIERFLFFSVFLVNIDGQIFQLYFFTDGVATRTGFNVTYTVIQGGVGFLTFNICYVFYPTEGY